MSIVIEHYKQLDEMRKRLLNKVKELNPKVRTMLVSAYEFQNNPIFETYLKQGIIDSFMQKPIKIIHYVAKSEMKYRLIDKV